MSKKASIIFGVIVAIIVALWIWTIFIPKDYISIGGSTSVDPVMQRLTNKYREDGDDKTQFVYSSSGSRGGLSNTESGIYKMGFISRDIDPDLQTKVVSADAGPTGFDPKNDQKTNSDAIYNYLLGKQSEKDKFNYLQIGTDAIILTYYPPADFAKYYADKFVINPAHRTGQQIIYDIYQGKMTFKKLAIALTGDPDVNSKLTDPKDELPIIPFARETGSGTRNSFEGLFKFKEKDREYHNNSPSRAIEYNSNGIMYTGIQSAVNAFGYLSLNYLPSIKQDSHLRTVIIGDDTVKFNPLDDTNFKDGKILLENFKTYPLTRPYIGLFKADLDQNLLQKFSGFFSWIGLALKTDEDNATRKIYQREGLIPELKFNWTLQTT